MKVLHGPANVANQPWMLSRYERQFGAKSDLVVNYNTWLGYPNDRCLSKLSEKGIKAYLSRAFFAATAPLRYDICHYYFGRSFFCWDDYGPRNPLWFADLKLAKKLGRRIIFTLQGCDVRRAGLSCEINEITPCREGLCGSSGYCKSNYDKQKMYFIDNILPLADKVFVLNPELFRSVPQATFLPYTSVDVDKFSTIWPKTDGRITIVHAPSDPLVKGTNYIIQAIEQLKNKYPIDLVMVKGVPYQQALAMYQQADIVIDQLLYGWYGALAVEVMALGKPVLCYLREQDFGFVPEQMLQEMPIRSVNLKSLATDIEQVLRERSNWREWGEKSREFVLRWHNPRLIAKAMLEIYRNPDAPFTI